MQALTADQKNYLYYGEPVGVTITGETIDGDPVEITEDDILEGSFSIERNWSHGRTVEIGCADTSELAFTLDNDGGRWSDLRWEGARLTVVLDIAGEPLQAGIFTVDEPPRKLTTMQIRALDDMARFNRPYAPAISYPATLLQIVQDACSKCNVTLHTATFDNRTYSVSKYPETEGLTFHQVVAWAAELAGCNAWIDHQAKLHLSWYAPTGGATLGPDDRFSYEMAEDDIEITGIIWRAGETDLLIGTNDYALIIEDNPLLQTNHENVLNFLFGKLGGFRYRPYKFTTIGYPHLWPGDRIAKLIDSEGGETTSIVTNHKYHLSGKSTIEARGETETVRGYATGAPFTPRQKRVLETVAKKEAAKHLTDIEQATMALNELMTNSLGFYTTVVDLPGGGQIQYLHDLPALEDSQIIWTQTEQGFAWTDQGWNDGSPVWQYGVTADGSMVARVLDVIGIRTEWIHIGPETVYELEEIYTWERYVGETWEEVIAPPIADPDPIIDPP